MSRLRLFFAPLLLAALCASATAAGIPAYKVTIVQQGSWMGFTPESVNDAGHFAGTGANEMDVVHMYWSPDTGPVALEGVFGVRYDGILILSNVNNHDQIALGTAFGPYLWSPTGGKVPLAMPPGYSTTAIYPTSINDDGEVVGWAYDHSVPGNVQRALKWKKDGTVVVMQPAVFSSPVAVNNHGEIATTQWHGQDKQAVLMRGHGDNVKLGDLPDNGPNKNSEALGLSENGYVLVNSIDSGGAAVACYWTEGTGLVPMGLGGSAVGMSRRAVVAGRTSFPNDAGWRGIAWAPGWGGPIFLDQHLAPGTEDPGSVWIDAISGNGTIIGDRGGSQAVIYTPVK